jgi:DNA primase
MIDAARDGCDLHTAEGRSHMASNAKALWELLPAGALKQQLLAEIADLAQLSTSQLNSVWYPRSASLRRAAQNTDFDSIQRTFNEGYSTKRPKNESRRAALGGQPVGRADHAARVLLDRLEAMATLNADDLNLLRHLPDPHGPLFAWLEGQWHEHGALPWVALREGLRGHASEDHAVNLMAGYELGTEDPEADTLSELRHLINRMLIEDIKVQESQAIESAKTEPQALALYRQLQARRRLLEAASQAGAAPASAG